MSQAMDDIQERFDALTATIAAERGQVRALIAELQQLRTQVEQNLDKDAILRGIDAAIAQVQDIAPDEPSA